MLKNCFDFHFLIIFLIFTYIVIVFNIIDYWFLLLFCFFILSIVLISLIYWYAKCTFTHTVTHTHTHTHTGPVIITQIHLHRVLQANKINLKKKSWNFNLLNQNIVSDHFRRKLVCWAVEQLQLFRFWSVR